MFCGCECFVRLVWSRVRFWLDWRLRRRIGHFRCGGDLGSAAFLDLFRLVLVRCFRLREGVFRFKKMCFDFMLFVIFECLGIEVLWNLRHSQVCYFFCIFSVLSVKLLKFRRIKKGNFYWWIYVPRIIYWLKKSKFYVLCWVTACLFVEIKLCCFERTTFSLLKLWLLWSGILTFSSCRC